MLYFELKALISYIQMMIYGFILAKKFQKRSNFYLRAVITIVVFFAADLVVSNIYPIKYEGFLFSVLFILYMLLLIAQIFVSFLIMYREKVTSLLFLTAVAYILMDTGNWFLGLIRLLPQVEENINEPWVIVLVAVLPTVLLGVGMYAIMKRKNLWEIETSNKSKLIFAISAIIIGLIVGRLKDSGEHNVATQFILIIYSILVNIMQLIIMFFVMGIKKSRGVVEQIKNILRLKERQNYSEAETIRELSIFAHDWKNRSLYYAASNVTEVGKTITKYEDFVNTGNAALDIMLADKNEVCKRKCITFNCMADGKLLNFMEPSDICALFGNALDNAIEGCEKVEDDKPKCILMCVKIKSGRIYIHIENSKPEKSAETDSKGRLISDKVDSSHHGFGITSMSRICDSYGGILTFDDCGSIFVLNIFFDYKLNSSKN